MRKATHILLGATIVLLAHLSSQVAEAQRFAPGYCPTVTAHENFDKTKFFGNWIEVEKTPSIFDLMMRCLVVDYSDDQDNTVNVVVRGISLAGLPLTVNGDGLLQDVHRSGFYSIRYGFGVPFQGTLTTIIDTDYDDYAVVYSCTNSLLSGVFHSEYIWVLSRSGKISNPTRQNIYEKLDKLSINRSGLTMSDRSTCPTNSSNIARESDKDLAGQVNLNNNNNGAASPSGTNSADQSGSGPQAAGASNGTPSASLEKVNPEPTQKSVVVPLLYDSPSPASSSTVGSAKPSAVQKGNSPPAPVENKVPQLPLASAMVSKQQVGSAKPQVAQAAPVASQAATSQLASSSSSSSSSGVSSSASAGQQQAAPSVAQPKLGGQAPQPQAQSLLAKIQQKP